MMNKKMLLGFARTIILVWVLFFPQTVSAHVLETSGSVGAVMHIDPEDDPIVGELSGFFFEFKDKDGKFTPESCNCTFYIEQGGKEVFAQPLFQANENPSLTSASIFFTFPEKDIYKIKVEGSPKTSGEFESFKLEYDIRVSRESTGVIPIQKEESAVREWIKGHVGHIVGAGALVVFLIFALVRRGGVAK